MSGRAPLSPQASTFARKSSIARVSSSESGAHAARVAAYQIQLQFAQLVGIM